MDEPRYEYDNFKVDPPRVDDGWYLVKDGITYRVEVPFDKMRFTKSINILTGEVYYPSNADRIRAMSDEELAEFAAGTGQGCAPGENFVECCFDHQDGPVEADCRKCWLDWLKEEAVSDG